MKPWKKNPQGFATVEVGVELINCHFRTISMTMTMKWRDFVQSKQKPRSRQQLSIISERCKIIWIQLGTREYYIFTFFPIYFYILHLNLFLFVHGMCLATLSKIHRAVRWRIFRWGSWLHISHLRYASKTTAMRWFTSFGLTQSTYGYW